MRATLRADTGSGTKDWFVSAYANGVVIKYGKTGQKMRERKIEKEDCVNRSPFKEAHKRLTKKINEKKGYEIIENSRINENLDDPHHLLIIMRKSLPNEDYFKSINVAKEFISSRFKNLEQAFLGTIDAFLPQKPTGELKAMIPVEDWSRAQVLLILLHLAPEILKVLDFTKNELGAMALYEKHNMEYDINANRVAIALGMLGKPEIFKDTQTANTWFF